MLFGSVSANAVTVESDDAPKRSGAAVEMESSGDVYFYNTNSSITGGAILHAWCWSFDAIKANMELIADSGYTAVQTSPANLCYRYSEDPSMLLMGDLVTEYGKIADFDGVKGSNDAWWWHYQPVDYTVGNYQLGTEQDYIDMCTEAEKYGIKIITDVVANHTARDYTAVSDDLLEAAGGITRDQNGNITARDHSKLYHNHWDDKRTPNGTRYQDAFFNLEGIDNKDIGLPDINTENEGYQAYLIDVYLNRLIKDGCDGFRFDTAKHFALPTEDEENNRDNTFWQVVTGNRDTPLEYTINGTTHQVKFNQKYENGEWVTLNPDLFLYGEYLQDINTGTMSELSNYVGLVASGYGSHLRKDLAAKDFSQSDIRDQSGTWSHNVSVDKLVTWVESHDTYCNDHESAVLTDRQVRWGWAVIAARKGGTPLFFSRPNNSTRANYWGDNTIGARGNDEFFSEEVAEVNKFRKAMGNNSEKLRYPNGNTHMIQIDRGNAGTVIVNTCDSDCDIDTETSMEVGRYIDSVSGGVFEVYSSSGINKIRGHLLGGKVAVIYLTEDARLSVAYSSKEFSGTQAFTLYTNKPNSEYAVIASGQTVASGSFTNGRQITVDDNMINTAYGSRIFDIRLSAPGSSGRDVFEHCYFTKLSDADEKYIYFDDSVYGWNSVYAHIYNENGNSNASYPGAAMTYDTSLGLYKIRIPPAQRNGRVIFSDNGSTVNRYPGDNADGLPVNDTERIFSYDASYTDNAKWEDYIANNELTADGNGQDVESYSYIYFLNNGGWSDENIRVSLWNDDIGEFNGVSDSAMIWSDDLKCYYFKYDTANNFDKVKFTDISSEVRTTGTLTAQPGKVFVGGSDDQWISTNGFNSFTINFNNSGNWNKVNIYLWNGDVNNVWPGVPMTSRGNNIYSYTYYYLSGEDNPYTSFIINSKTAGVSGGFQTEDLTIGENNRMYDPSSTDAAFSKQITVTLKYYDYKLGSGSEDAYRENADCVTQTQVTVRSNATAAELSSTETLYAVSLDGAVTKAVEKFKPNNRFDDFVFYTSQSGAVKGLGVLTDNRLSGDTLGSKISPHNLGGKTATFGKVHATVEPMNAAEKWVTYKNNGVEVEAERVKSDLSNIDEVVVWGFNKPKKYTVRFNYPTSETAAVGEVVKSGFFTADPDKCVSFECEYNELLDPDGANLTSDMRYSENWKFDGWYAHDTNSSGYVKVSSDIAFGSRVTSDLDLYAVFRERGKNIDDTVTVTSVSDGADAFMENGTMKYRFNTIMNIFGRNPEKAVTAVSAVYVELNSGDECTADDIAAIRALAGSTAESGTVALSCGTRNYIRRDHSSFNLSSKDRLQFSLNLTSDQVSGAYSNVLAFTACRIDGEWIISDNCVQFRNGAAYRFLN